MSRLSVSMVMAVRGLGSDTFSYLLVWPPLALDLGIELNQELCAGLGSRLPKGGLVDKEVDAEVLVCHNRLIGNGEATNSCDESPVSSKPTGVADLETQ